MKLLVGLGNPEQKYIKNRHNIGFIATDNIAEFYKFSSKKKAFKATIQEGTINGGKVVLLQPQTYMNNSGVSVQAAKKFYKIDIDDIYVFHDELDIPVGRIKLKIGGGSAGHNGLKSIINCVGKDFTRIRIGIDHPGDKNLVSNYVLSNFNDDELKLVNIKLNEITQDIEKLVFKKEDKKIIEIQNSTKKINILTKIKNIMNNEQ
ncbi:MAG: aminoacyl-tRNA hydrolase [Alphaproteobacteria bacterium]|jgi:PTH1 family peptidyl-tRNA hydrolase|tara:strand:+ start:33681 stop:34295 length:615 start_codon:yes stop_codon:yes gene_type:complete